MSIPKLKASRDHVVANGIGTYLDVVKHLIASIDSHIAEEAELATTDSALKKRVTMLQLQVNELNAELARVLAVANPTS